VNGKGRGGGGRLLRALLRLSFSFAKTYDASSTNASSSSKKSPMARKNGLPLPLFFSSAGFLSLKATMRRCSSDVDGDWAPRGGAEKTNASQQRHARSKLLQTAATKKHSKEEVLVMVDGFSERMMEPAG